MIGTKLIEELVQSVALSHLVKGYDRVSLLLLAAPESGKTTVTAAASAKHVSRLVIMSGRSLLREDKDHPHVEYFLFNDLSGIRAMSHQATALAVLILNHYTQGETGRIAFAGKRDVEEITRPIGVIACMPFDIFTDHRSRWKEMGFISRMVPFAYAYSDNLVAEIKDAIDNGHHLAARAISSPKIKPTKTKIHVTVTPAQRQVIRRLADVRSPKLGQIGLRLLHSYHALVRAHAIRAHRVELLREDLDFLKAVDRYVSIETCEVLK